MQSTRLSKATTKALNKTARYSSAQSGAINCSLGLRTRKHPLRATLENYIAVRYARHHRASIEHFMPNLLVLEEGLQTRAALGLNSARNQALFLECYLDKPVEQAISQQLCTPVDRSKVIEIGNLAASQKAGSHLLFTLLSALLDQAGYRWIVFTATPCVQTMVENMGFSLQAISDAKAECINASENWGSYYETRPQVMVGCIDDAMRKALSPAMRAELTRHSKAISDIAATV